MACALGGILYALGLNYRPLLSDFEISTFSYCLSTFEFLALSQSAHWPQAIHICKGEEYKIYLK
jgi:hypothetical protein